MISERLGIIKDDIGWLIIAHPVNIVSIRIGEIFKIRDSNKGKRAASAPPAIEKLIEPLVPAIAATTNQGQRQKSKNALKVSVWRIKSSTTSALPRTQSLIGFATNSNHLVEQGEEYG
jgi:hypothetical protein